MTTSSVNIFYMYGQYFPQVTSARPVELLLGVAEGQVVAQDRQTGTEVGPLHQLP